MTEYDRFFHLRAKAHERFGDVLSLPVGEQPYEFLKRVYRTRYPNGRVLDFGSGAQKPLRKQLGIGDDRYHTCDTDPSGDFTYRRLEDIPSGESYDMVAANQVFEHLDFDEALRTASALARLVARGGMLQASVPNAAHPTRYWGDPTHKTPWTHLTLCALIESSGLVPESCIRCNKRPGPRWYERSVIHVVCRVFRMDWCDTIYIVGRKER